MFNNRYNTSFYNPQDDYNNNSSNQPTLSPYLAGDNMPVPQPMQGGLMANSVYPFESAVGNVPNSPYAFSKGGMVPQPSQAASFKPLADLLRKQGQRKDTILAHINKDEAKLLDSIAGSDVNPITGLPQFGLFRNPKKWLKSIAGGAGGAIVGNMLLPGLGGLIGGAVGAGVGTKLRGRKDYGSSMIRGAGMGAMLPTLSSLAGSGLSSLGAKGLGSTLSEYGDKNSILTALGYGGGESSNLSNLPQSNLPQGTSTKELMDKIANIANSDLNHSTKEELIKEAIAQNKASQSFSEGLLGNTKNYLSKPKNLLTMATLASSFANRPKPAKEKSPEQMGAEQKRLEKALRLNPQELSEREAAMLAEEQMKRRIQRRKFLPEERIGDVAPLYVRTNTPDEYSQQGKWLNYYDNPQFTGAPRLFKHGGPVTIEIQETAYPLGEAQPENGLGKMLNIMDGSQSHLNLAGLGRFLVGTSGGQDDVVPAIITDGHNKSPAGLAHGEYIMRADTVSNAGDGNSIAGAKRLNIFEDNLRKHKSRNTKFPPKTKPLERYMPKHKK